MKPKVKIYIATLYSRREEMIPYADDLRAHGFEVTSRWVYGGEEGLDRTDIAMVDLEDVLAADIILSFTSPHGTPTQGGGRHVEFGIGVASGKVLALVGERENVFHHLPSVKQYPTYLAAREYLIGWQAVAGLFQ